MTALICGSSLLLFVLGLLWVRLQRLNLADVFLLAIGLFFGAYTVIDCISRGTEQIKDFPVLIVFLPIWTAALALWAFVRINPKLLRDVTLARFRQDAINASGLTVFIVIAIGVAFNAYSIAMFGAYDVADAGQLTDLEQDLPYWYTTFGMLVPSTMYGAGLAAWWKAETASGSKKLLWLILAGFGFLFFFSVGRRALFAFLVPILWRLVSKKGRWWAVGFIVVSLPVLVMASNLFQAYRLFSYRGVPVVSIEDAGEVIKSAFDFQKTSTNLEERPALWRFNYEIVNADMHDRGSLHWGGIFLREIPNYIPAAIWKGKAVFDSEMAVVDTFELEHYDRPSNIFSYTYADFGLLNMLVAPLMLLFLVWVCAKVLTYLKDPFLRSTLMGFAIFYAMNIEALYCVPVQLARDFLVVTVVYLLCRTGLRQGKLFLQLAVHDSA